MYYVSKRIIDGNSVSFSLVKISENCFYKEIEDLVMNEDPKAEKVAENHYRYNDGDEFFISKVDDNYFEPYVFE